MHRTSESFSILQAIAATVTLTILFWSVGLPSLQFVEAANVITLSDTLSDSTPSAVSNHSITFVTPTGVTNGQTMTVDFSDGPFVIGSVDETDVDVLDDSSNLTVTDDCEGGGGTDANEVSAVFAAEVLTITFCAGDGASIPANGTTTILIGTNATFAGDTGDANAQLTNPVAGSYEINVTAGNGADTGETRVAITPAVTVNASVDTRFTFTVDGVASGATVNVADITDGPTTPTLIDFGELTSGNASTTAQDLTVETNATNGFVVTVTAGSQLVAGSGADIDGFRNGNFDTTPTNWVPPTPVLGDDDTYGHWGITSDDPTLGTGLTDVFDAGGSGDQFVSASTTPVEVFRHNGPTDGNTTGEGTTRVGYKVEISALQEAADDYTATLTYVATPVF